VRHARADGVLRALAVVAVLAACNTGLSDEAYTYCVTQAPPGELDAAAEALNIAPDADRDFEANRDRGDPTFQRVCEYAYEARDRNIDVPPAQPGQPDTGSPSAPLNPQRSEDAAPPAGASASPAPS
jgi:hypothetical protein